MNHLEENLKSYKPTFYIPDVYSSLIKGQNYTNSQKKFEIEEMILPDKSKIILDWYP